MKAFNLRVCIIFLMFIATSPAFALDTPVGLDGYNHSVWTTASGAPANIEDLAQTSDGWLWLRAHDALYRFDGVRFERYDLPKQDQPGRSHIIFIHALRDGALLIAYRATGGISILHPDGTLEDVVNGVLRMELANSVAEDLDGGLWFPTARGLAYVSHGVLRTLGAKDGLPEGRVCSVVIDGQGGLWVLHIHGIYRRGPRESRFEKLNVDVGQLSMISTLNQSADGRVWLAGFERSNPWIRPLSFADTKPLVSRPQTFNRVQSRNAGEFDNEGNLWSWNCPQRPCRLIGSGNSQAPVRLWPMSEQGNDSEGQVLEDSSGSIWISNQLGLERYRKNKVISVKLPGASNSLNQVTDESGHIFIADEVSSTVWRISADGQPVREPSQPTRIVANDRNGGLLLGGRRQIVRRYQGHTENISLPPYANGKAGDHIVLGMQDDGRVLWMYAPEVGLMGYLDGQWYPRSHFNLPPIIMLTTPAGGGRLWIACPDQSVVLYDNDKLTRFDASMIGVATSLQYGEEMIAAGDRGIAVLKGKQFFALTAFDPEVLRNVTGLTTTVDGDRWINGAKGVVHVRREDWRASVADPAIALRYELIGELDGYKGVAATANRLHTAFTDAQGILWFTSSEGIVRLDPRQLSRKEPAAKISLVALNTPDARRRPVNLMHLPPGASTLNIQYTALGVGKPDLVHFQYRLVGEDRSWLDAGDRRVAFFTNLPSGRHRFEVRAINAVGVWNELPTVLDFEIEPTLTQTTWFRFACFSTAVFALYLLYRYRLSAATSRLNERMQVRLAERERIARTLHDSFLQSVQGLTLTMGRAVDALPPDSDLRQSLSPLLESARATISQGRDTVYELRTETTDEIESALSELTRLMAIKYPGVVFQLSVDGMRLPLRPKVATEIVEIASEAVRNAYQHARAREIVVRLTYGVHDLSLSVRDDGSGMVDTATGGADAKQHWGLRGMRERSARIDANFNIESQPDYGTAVTLRLPARHAYFHQKGPWLRRLLLLRLPSRHR